LAGSGEARTRGDSGSLHTDVMLVLWPLLLAGAAVLLVKSRQRGLGQRGWPWFAGWTFAGALFVFSLLTGFSIGVFLFPPAAFAVFWLSLNAPYGRELAGFPVGIAAVLLVALLQPF
jgi:hypothetical protein